MEPPHERIQSGKPETGNIIITMTRENESFLVSIRDDGYGINLDKVRKKAKRIHPSPETLSHSELQNLIFEPGFSTQEQTSIVSGRGVGLDFVKATVLACGGEIRVESSPGNGTCFYLLIPKHYELQDKAEQPGL